MFTTFTRTIIATAVIASALAVPTATATPAVPDPAPLSPRVEATDATLTALTPMTPAWAKAIDAKKTDYARISAEEAGYASIPQIGCYDPLAYWDHAGHRCLRVVP